MDFYKNSYLSISANGLFLRCESGGRLKLHGIFGQTTAAAVEGDIQGTKLNNKVHFKFNDREGFVLPGVALPLHWAVGDTNEDFMITFTTAAQCYFTTIYSDGNE